MNVSLFRKLVVGEDAMDAMAEYREALRKMLDADNDDQSVAESGFAIYIRWLVRSIDEVARDDADQDVLDALGELREALPKMVAVAVTANDVLPWAGRALGNRSEERRVGKECLL